jgi:aryl-alcohol dehydrogenase-like predicted oxidoreductase
MINRREFLGTTAGAGAAMAFPPELLRVFSQQRGKMIQRAVPSTGEMFPVISYAPRPTATPAPGPIPPMPEDVPVAKAVLKTFIENGGKVVDVLHGGPIGENAARTAALELGVQDKFFWTTPLSVSVPVLPGYSGPPPKPAAADVRAEIEKKFAAFKVSKIEIVMVGAGVDMESHLGVLREMKKEGRVKYIGVHDLLFPPNLPNYPYPPTAKLEEALRTHQIDFIATDYSVADRRVEQVILPLAQEKKVGFLAYFPFDRRRIFARASETPLPAWAADFDAKTWAQFFLKYVVSHPAVTMARVGTTKSEHMLDDIGGGTGRLPNEAQRKRMAELVDSFPANPQPAQATQPIVRPPGQPAPQPPAPVVLPAETLDRYVGEYNYAAANQGVTVRRDGERMFVKIAGTLPEAPLVARGETRFQGPFGLFFEFKPDGSAIVEQGPFRLSLVRR